MELLVIGGSGYIGSSLVETLLKKGHNVSVLDVRKPISDVKWINKDIRDNLEDVIKGYDAVYHLAAIANARICGLFPQKACEVNILGSLNVINACMKNDIPRLLYASTTWMSGVQTGDIVQENSPVELSKLNTIYGATKLSVEGMLSAYQKECGKPNYTIMRYGIPYGKRMWEGLVVKAFLDQAERFKKITVMGDGQQGRNFLYLDDMCEAQELLLDKKAENKVYHLAGTDFITIKQLAEEVAKNIPAEIVYIPNTRKEPDVKRITTNRIYQDFGWKPTTSFSEGIKKCVEWWKTLDSDQKEEVPYFTI